MLFRSALPLRPVGDRPWEVALASDSGAEADGEAVVALDMLWASAAALAGRAHVQLEAAADVHADREALDEWLAGGGRRAGAAEGVRAAARSMLLPLLPRNAWTAHGREREHGVTRNLSSASLQLGDDCGLMLCADRSCLAAARDECVARLEAAAARANPLQPPSPPPPLPLAGQRAPRRRQAGKHDARGAERRRLAGACERWVRSLPKPVQPRCDGFAGRCLAPPDVNPHAVGWPSVACADQPVNQCDAVAGENAAPGASCGPCLAPHWKRLGLHRR